MRRAIQRRAAFRSPCIPPSAAVREAKSCRASFTPRWPSLWAALPSFYGRKDNVLVRRLRARKPRSRETIDDRDVEWAFATRFQADRGLVVLHDVRGSSIDPSARDGFTSKMGIDATRPLGADPAMFDKATL